ncbi:MAG: hypothetical protein N5P05_004527 (plasmid) [Chroococcopsis gigantea SAG 12.99]|jgi:hypothetical protein|nr:hypothetical protein [Chroococcopsis gigantea SAG 12.99]
MYHDNSSGCGQTNAPINRNASKSISNSVKLPRTHAEWSKALSPIPAYWVLTPVKDKKPLRPNWQDEAPIERPELLNLLVKGQKLQGERGEWHCRWTGVGVRLGTISGGLIAIDADGDNGESKLQELCGGELPFTISWTSGKQGRRQLLYKIPSEHHSKMRTIKLGCGEDQYLEFRWEGCQSVLPPSKHPETGQYRWLISPEEAEVAIAPDWLIDYFLSARFEDKSAPDLFSSLPDLEEIRFAGRDSVESAESAEPKNNYQQRKQQPSSDIERAIIFLNALAAWRADNYDEWLKVGMALHSICPSLLYLWEAWSRQSSKYQPGVCEKKWKSFSPQKGIGIGSLCQWAKEDGWQPAHKTTSFNGTTPHRSAQEHSRSTSSNSNNGNGKQQNNGNGDNMNSDITLKQAIAKLINEGIAGSDRSVVLSQLSSSYRIPFTVCERLWGEVEEELEREDIKPDIRDRVKKHLNDRTTRLDVFKIFPASLAKALTDCANAFPGPVEGLVLPLLGTAAGCVGTGAEVVIKKSSGYKQPCLIRTLLLAETGEMKSPLMSIITAPLLKLEKEALKRYKQEVKDYEAAVASGDQSAQRPVRERFALMDCTPEEMIRIHASCLRGFTFIHDEWGGYVKGFNKYRKGIGNDRESDLSEFNGSTYIRDRVNDESIFIEKTSISRIGGYQLSLIYELLEKSEDLDGFLNRWMMAAPPFPPAYKDFVNDDSDQVIDLQHVLYTAYKSLRSLPASQYSLTLEAKQKYQAWQHHLVDLILKETRISLKGFYPKLESYTARFALLLHLLNAVIEGVQPEDEISGETMEKAIYLAQYFLGQTQWIHCRKNTGSDGLSGLLALIQEFCVKKAGPIAAREIKMAISSIKKSTAASTNFIRGKFKELAEMGYGIVEGCGIHIRYRATNQHFDNPPPPEPLKSSVTGISNFVDTPINNTSTSTKLSLNISEMVLSVIGNILDTGLVAIEPSDGVTIQEPSTVCTIGDNIDPPVANEIVDEIVDVDKFVDTPINTPEAPPDKQYENFVDLLIDSENTSGGSQQSENNIGTILDKLGKTISEIIKGVENEVARLRWNTTKLAEFINREFNKSFDNLSESELIQLWETLKYMRAQTE